MCYLRLRQGPEGRRLNVSPARKGWVLEGKPERRRRGTLTRPTPTCFRHTRSQQTLSNEINATESTNQLIWTGTAECSPGRSPG
jgi:hypothetical protein